MNKPTIPYLDDVSESQLKRFGNKVDAGTAPVVAPGPAPAVEHTLHKPVEHSPPPALMSASRGPQAAKHRLEMVRHRKTTGSHVQRSVNLVKARTRRAKK